MEGDENIAIFRKICLARKRRSVITSVIDNNRVLCTNNDDIVNAFLIILKISIETMVESFGLLKICIGLLSIPYLKKNFASPTQNKKSFSRSKNSQTTKHQGRMDLLIELFKYSWNFIKREILDVFTDFHKNGIIKVVNYTYIAFIAKKEKCSLTTDFRPISFTTTLYKLMAKVMAKRLKITLPEIVSEKQMAFVKDKLRMPF